VLETYPARDLALPWVLSIAFLMNWASPLKEVSIFGRAAGVFIDIVIPPIDGPLRKFLPPEMEGNLG